MLDYSIVGLAALLLLFVMLLVMHVRLVKRVSLEQTAREELQTRLVESEHQLSKMYDVIHEVRTGSLAGGNKVKELNVALEQIQAKIEELSDLDPDSRLYSKASKLVASGATIEELMQECELPRAEAELLFSLRKN